LTNNRDETLNMCSLIELDFRDVEILKFEETEAGKAFRARLYISFCHSNRYQFASIELDYEKSQVMWNKLNGLSWFEEDKWKK